MTCYKPHIPAPPRPHLENCLTWELEEELQLNWGTSTELRNKGWSKSTNHNRNYNSIANKLSAFHYISLWNWKPCKLLKSLVLKMEVKNPLPPQGGSDFISRVLQKTGYYYFEIWHRATDPAGSLPCNTHSRHLGSPMCIRGVAHAELKVVLLAWRDRGKSQGEACSFLPPKCSHPWPNLCFILHLVPISCLCMKCMKSLPWVCCGERRDRNLLNK